MTIVPQDFTQGTIENRDDVMYPQNSPLQIWGLHFTKKYSQDIK